MQYIFDKSYYGLLTAIFEVFERNDGDVVLCHYDAFQASFFESEFAVLTEESKAQRVQEGIIKICGKEKAYECFKIFQFEDLEVQNALFHVLIRIFKGEKELWNNYGDSDVITCAMALKKVRREAHRMKAFIRFQKSEDGMFFTEIEPDFNVLPLIIKFFKNRYSDQQWIIYDVKRKYGMYYDLSSVSAVTLQEYNNTSKEILPAASVALDMQECKYQNLWIAYFKSTNIVERKNLKLHIQHVPKRYWKYMVEK
jgi:probable DNA metabolism protein